MIAVRAADGNGVRGIEERALNAWPALQTVVADGWLFRFAEGYTKRANSVNALTPAGSFADTLRLAEELYSARGLPTIFRLSPLAGAEADAALEGRRYARVDETLVMTVPAVAAADPGVVIRESCGGDWAEGFAAAAGLDALRRRIHERMLDVIALPAAFALLKEGGETVAFGLAVEERGMVGLFDLVTLPAARRRGFGRRMVAALVGWGAARGASSAYLQVTGSNAAARALYGRIGFREAYRYHYRVKG